MRIEGASYLLEERLGVGAKCNSGNAHDDVTLKREFVGAKLIVYANARIEVAETIDFNDKIPRTEPELDVRIAEFAGCIPPLPLTHWLRQPSTCALTSKVEFIH